MPHPACNTVRPPHPSPPTPKVNTPNTPVILDTVCTEIHESTACTTAGLTCRHADVSGDCDLAEEQINQKRLKVYRIGYYRYRNVKL